MFSSRLIYFISTGILLVSFSYTILSCKNRSVPNVSHIKTDVHLVRFEEELFKLDTNQLAEDLKNLILKYPEFSKLFFVQITQLSPQIDTIDTTFLTNLKDYIADSLSQFLYKNAQMEFNDNNAIIGELSKTVKYIKYYFPEESDPVFYTLISNFAYGNFIFNEKKSVNGIGIGLEFFLGPLIDYKSFGPENPVFSNYLTRSFNKDHLIKKTFEAWVEDKFGNAGGNQFLDALIQKGKKLYVLSRIIPEIQDTVLFDFSKEQLLWCLQNKVEIWSFFLDQKLLFSTEMSKFNKYINPGPISPGMPSNAPGQTAGFIGYQIVASYFKNHPEKTLQDLVKATDAQLFLKESKFKPRNE